MMNKKFILPLVFFIVVCSIIFLVLKKKNDVAVQKKLSNLDSLNKAVNFKKNKRENSIEYKLIVNNEIDKLADHIDSLTDKNELNSFKNILLAKSKVENLSLQSKKTLFNIILSYESDSKLIQVYKNRFYPYLFINTKNSEFLKKFKGIFDKNKDAHNFVILDEMTSWNKVPKFILDYLDELFQSKDHHYNFNALTLYSSLRNEDQVKEVYKLAQNQYSKFSEMNKSLFHKINLNKINVLKLDKKLFTSLLDGQLKLSPELKLKIIEHFSLIKERKEIVRKIASGNSNPWIKKKARSLLEKHR